MTEWRSVPEWGAYEVSSDGRVRRVVRSTGRGGGGFLGERTPYRARFGHAVVRLRQDGRTRAIGVHRLVATAFHGPPPSPKHEAAHIDGDASNNSPENLRWATRAENERDKVAHGRSNRGERQHMAKLSATAVIEIKRGIEAGLSQSVLAAQHGVARTTIMSIVSGRSWRWLRLGKAA